MTIETDRTTNKLVSGTIIFGRVERFIHNHPGLQLDEVAKLAKLTKELLETPPADRQGLS
jgi:hypothetical protein